MTVAVPQKDVHAPMSIIVTIMLEKIVDYRVVPVYIVLLNINIGIKFKLNVLVIAHGKVAQVELVIVSARNNFGNAVVVVIIVDVDMVVIIQVHQVQHLTVDGKLVMPLTLSIAVVLIHMTIVIVVR